MQQIQLNIIPFTPLKTKLKFAFYSEKQKGMASIKWDKLFDEFPSGRERSDQFYYSDFQPARAGAIEQEIELLDTVGFAKRYFSYLILNFFKQVEGAVVFPCRSVVC
jgi:hypothetical protein